MGKLTINLNDNFLVGKHAIHGMIIYPLVICDSLLLNMAIEIIDEHFHEYHGDLS